MNGTVTQLDSLRVLLVDHDLAFGQLVNQLLSKIPQQHFSFQQAPDFGEALKSYRASQHDIYLAEYREGDAGLQYFLEGAAQAQVNAPIILLTSSSDSPMEMPWVRNAVADYLIKSKLDVHLLERVFRYCLAHAVTQKELQKSQERFNLAAQGANDGIWDWNLASGDLYLSSRFKEMLGLEELELNNTLDNWMERVHRDDVHALRRKIKSCIQNGIPKLEMEYRIRHKDSAWRWMLLRGVAIHDDEGQARWLAGSQTDISLRKQAEEAIDEERNLLRVLIDHLPDFIYIKDQNGFFLLNNRAHLKVLGAESPSDVLGKSDYDFFSKPDADRFWRIEREILRSGKPFIHWEEPLNIHSGQKRWISSTKIPLKNTQGEIMGLVCISRDITDRIKAEQALRESEEQLRQSQKMEAIGRLAGGVAHDFNNILMAIMGHAELMLKQHAEDSEVGAHTTEIKKSAERAASLTKQLLAFSRRQVLQPKILNLNEMITDLEKMLLRLIGEDIQLITNLDPNLGQVKADPGQIDQVILNLSVNGRDSMPNGGKLIISSRNIDIASTKEGPLKDLSSGSYALITVKDMGTGIKPEHLGHLFEPFFTTKDKGKGTGLGLSTVYGIVKQSGGEVVVNSQLGKGTEFLVYLPLIPVSLPDKPRVTVPSQAPQGTETVLLVEDENSVRSVVKQVLEMNGYHVIEAQDGREAMDMAMHALQQIDLLLTDLVMPHMGGAELSEKLLNKSEHLKVVLMSGYTDWEPSNSSLKDCIFLQKPFTPDVLTRKVREALDRA